MISVNQNAFLFLSGWLNSLPDFLHSIDIKNVCFDSREVQTGDCYVALPSVASNERHYIQQACDAGAVLVVCSDDIEEVIDATVSVKNIMALSGEILHKQLGSATQSLNVVGVTGTNGKSSICHYLAQVMEALKTPSAVMGTLGYGKWDNLHVSGMTTLPLEKLHTVLSDLSDDNQIVAMEVSSHGLEQQRLSGVEFETAIFSNLSRDHLDYHGTMEAYGAEKSKLFVWPSLKQAIINIDDSYAAHLIASTNAKTVVTYGMAEQADLRFSVDSLDEKGMNIRFFWKGECKAISLPLYGQFNAYNVAAVVAYGLIQDHDLEKLLSICSELKPVQGRMQQVQGSDLDPLVLVDYAHTPDALEQVLQSVRTHNTGKVYLVVGCGGDRDQGKRPLMGQISVKLAEQVIFTSDNPRNEAPAKICDDMTHSLSGSFVIELDREKAINQAVLLAGKQDLVVIAGKGHEDYQEINGQKHFFSDVSVAQKAMHMRALA